MKESKIIYMLRELGFNRIEAEIYIFLLPHSPMTAYKIAQKIGKPAANVYKAVERLARKGALVIEDGPSRTCRAVPTDIFLRRAEQDFRDLAGAAREALKDIEFLPVDETVCRVESIDQVYAYCREMIEKAKEIVVIDAFPVPLQKIAPMIAKAVKRGVEVRIEAYAPVEIEGARIVLIPIAERLVRQWSAQQLNIVVDGKENLMALLGRDGSTVLQAYWSNSPYLSCLQHGGRLCEQTLMRAIQAKQEGAPPDEIIAIIENHPFLINHPVPGSRELNRRYAAKKDKA